MSKLETNQVDPATGTTLTLGTSGDTVSIPSGVTIANSGTATGFGESNTPYFEMRLNSDQTGIADNTSTKIQFDTIDLDSNSGADVTTNHRYTVQSGDAGKYLLLATGRGDTASANDNRDVYVMIYKNGTAIARNEFGTSNTSDAQRIGKTVYTIEDLSEGDYIETYIHINSSASANTGIAKSFISRMSGFKISSS